MARNIQAYKLGVTITADAAKALAALKSVDAQATKTQSSLLGISKAGGQAFSGLAGAVSVAGGNMLTSILGGIASGMSEVTQQGIAYNRQIESSAVALKQLTGSAEAANKHLGDLEKLAIKTPFELQDLTNASLKLQAFGYEAENVIKILPAISDAASIAAAGTGDYKGSIDGVILALGQMRAKGKASLEEINQLTERGIPAMDILAQKIGKSVAETTRLVSSGRARGDVASRLLVEGFSERYAGLGDQLSGTLAGKESNALDALKRQAGNAARETTEAYKNALDQAISGAQSATVTGFAKEYDKRLANDAQFFTDVIGGKTSAKEIGAAMLPTIKDTATELGTTLKSSLGAAWTSAGNFLNGIAAGVGASMGTKSAEGTKTALKIQSPSKVYIEFGEWVAEGFAIGVENGSARVAEALANMISGGGLTGSQKRSVKGLAGLNKREPEFMKKLIAGAQKRGINPDHLLNTIATETAGTFSPSITNPYGYTGLIQFGTAAAKDLGTTTKDLRAMTATKQLDYVFKYLDMRMRQFGAMDSQAKVYAAVGAGNYSKDDQAVKFKGGTKAYNLNKAVWDWNKDGQIQQWEFGPAAVARMGAGEKFSFGGGVGSASSASKPVNVTASRTAPMPVMIVDTKGASGGTIRTGADFLGLSDIDPSQLGKLNGPKLLDLPSLFSGNSNAAATAGASIASATAANNTAQNYKDLMGATTPQPLFGNATLDVGAFGANGGDLAAQASGIEKAMAGLRAGAEELKGLAKGAFGDFAAGLGGIVEQFVLTGETGPAAMKKLAAGVLASVASQAAVKSIFYLAEGIAAATNPFTAYMAPGYFTASAVMAGIAGGTALAGRAIAGKGNKGQVSAEQQRRNEISTKTSENYAGNKFERREFGGPVYAGRAYIVGERRPEVFTPASDGYIHSSGAAYRQQQRQLNALRQFRDEHGGNGALRKLIERMEATFSRLEAVNGDEYFIRMAGRNGRALGRSVIDAADRDSQIGARLGVRIA